MDLHVVRPEVAWKMLACGNTRGYELVATGELDSFLDGRWRKSTVASVHRCIERRVALTPLGVKDGSSTAFKAPQRQHRGRSRKVMFRECRQARPRLECPHVVGPP